MERDNSSGFGSVAVASTLRALMAAQPDPREACSYIQRRKAKISKNHLIFDGFAILGTDSSCPITYQAVFDQFLLLI